MRKFQFEENQIYHIYNRGVDKRKVFLKDVDYLRFLHDMFELNNKERDPNIGHYFKKNQNMKVQPSYLERRPRELLVEVLVFCLMPNHYHLILKQKKENGISKFMQKIGTGYTMSFNNEYNREGSLFQGRFKAVLVDKDPYLIHLLNYIHFNPLKLPYCNNSNLEKYRWNSFPDYIGKKNFPSITSREFLLNFYGSEERYKKEAREWLKEKDKNTSLIKNIILE